MFPVWARPSPKTQLRAAKIHSLHPRGVSVFESWRSRVRGLAHSVNVSKPTPLLSLSPPGCPEPGLVRRPASWAGQAGCCHCGQLEGGEKTV